MSTAKAVPDAGLTLLHDLVAAAVARFVGWADLVERSGPMDVGVVIDEAEELRRQILAAAGYADDLLARAPRSGPVALTVSAVASRTLAVAAVAASLNAAACAVRPVASGLRGDPLLPQVARASCRAVGRFLASAGQALEELTGPPQMLQLLDRSGQEESGTPRLRLVGATTGPQHKREGR